MNTNTPSGEGSQQTTPSQEQVISLGDILGQGSTYPIAGDNNPVPPAPAAPAVPPVDPSGTPNTVVPAVTPASVPPTSTPPSTGDEPTYLELAKSFTSPDASPEVKDLYTELLSTFKATSIDLNGNLLDKDNNIIISAEMAEDYLLTDNLPLNEEGALVGVNGVVLKTAEEFQKDDSIILSVKSALESNLDIQFGEDVEFPDTMEGIVELVSTGIKQKEKAVISSFLESNPEIKQFTNHLALGGTVESYKSSSIDYKSIDVKTLDNQTKLNLLTQSLKEQGNVNPGAFVELVSKAGEEAINTAAYDALKYLDTKQTETNAKRDAEVNALQARQQQETIEYWNKVETTVTQGKIANLNIPVKERQAFFDFMSKPVDENFNSAESIKAQQESLDFQLLVSYLRFKNGDLAQLATNIAREDRVKSLTERLNKGRTDRNGVPRTISSRGKAEGGIPSLNDILGNS